MTAPRFVSIDLVVSHPDSNGGPSTGLCIDCSHTTSQYRDLKHTEFFMCTPCWLKFCKRELDAAKQLNHAIVYG